MVDRKEDVTIVVFGRTGVGKSSLGNKIADRPIFKEGHTMTAETFEAASVNFQWPLDESIRIRFIDTPGFADNRPDVNNNSLLANILKFLKSLDGGFNIGMFCMPAKTRIDSHDIQELEMLRTILGQNVLQHIWFVVTQVNILKEAQQEDAYSRIPEELPAILALNGIKEFTKDRVLFADFDNFDKKFMAPVDILIRGIPKFKPEITLDLNSPEALTKCLASPAMKAMMKKYEEMFAARAKELERMNDVLRESATNNKVFQDQIAKREDDIEKLLTKVTDMGSKANQIQNTEQRPSLVVQALIGVFCKLLGI